MPTAALLMTLVLVVAALPDVAIAQGAATGGTKDVGSPTMVFPIRPRDEPEAPKAVPTRSYRAHPTYSSGRSVLIYRHRHHRR